ncbi:MAG: hypothetical protein ACI93R_002541 [Flavobacteriales bacterium]|jgi:hypothetical protein
MSALNEGIRHSTVTTLPTILQREREILQQILEQSLESSKQLLEQLFSATDDLLYELSDRASTNNEENLYFEAMREIRIKKKRLTEGFIESYVENFHKIAERCQQNKPNTHDDVDESELSILNREELETLLAQKNMAARTRDSYKIELHDLESRLNHFIARCTIHKDTNPLDPLQLSSSFVKACTENLNLEIKTRLIFFKLFEKHYLKQLGHIYADANSHLIDLGILPKVPRKHIGEKSNKDQRSTAIRAQEESDNNFPDYHRPDRRRPFQLEANALTSLMSSIRAAQKAMSPGAQAFSSYQNYSGNPGPVMASPELTEILTDSQRNVDEQISIDTPRNLLTGIVADILSLKDPEEPQALDQPDEDVINLVALFFDKLLEDESLPVAVQSLICRLQIPVLKVALHDKTFLTDDIHPARILLNTITEAGLAFDDSKPLERDPIYRLIVEGVQKTNIQFKLDNNIFREFTRKLLEKMETEQKKSSVVESRTNQTEAGKAKLRAARTFSQAALYDKLKDASLPTVLSQFLTGSWLQVMVITYIRNGKEEAAWVENEQLIGDLIWAAQDHKDEKSLERKERLVPGILNRIALGLEHVIDNTVIRQEKVNAIAEQLKTVASIDVKAPQGLSNEQKDLLGKTDESQKTWDEMTALERQQVRYEELSSKFYIDAKNMNVGTWIQYALEDKGKEIRCKLSAKIDSDNYMFVNRFGFKVITRTRRQFAYDMQFNKARPLDTTPMFERIMDRVVTQIKSLTQEM